MSSPIQLIVGLGNPGAEYEHTRHNAGVWFVQELAHAARVQLRYESKFRGFHGTAHSHGADYHLLVPSTYMNHSGQAVQAVAHYYKIPPGAILIAHDEIDLPVGIVRLKFDGGNGGHNGLKDIIDHLATKQFYRLRIGVGRPAQSKEVHDYVLSPPSRADREQINTALQQVDSVLPLLLAGECQKAMQQLHTE